ncbi:putative taurine catabolism dioxygenase [Candidatus Regiella insecticola 5.15]|uniref:Putative taurine catabolism dioxygenase n=1 Tax=Candidatus Regiella insecticola 5.15 TaxID=1005043 RepID=G2H295_9ENTR|nr:TauD/TfdA family dioxygenase [Candidatus Regiella insecticola]EGY27885.1 putative taurine catabolism dioxygenase [Candidatus Regiella insecticola 5.15]
MDNNNHLYEIAFHHANCNQFYNKYNDDKLFFKQHEYVISSLDIDAILPDTPVDEGTVANSKIPVSTISLTAYCIALSLYPVVYQGENQGRLIRHVVPRRNAEKQISSHGSLKTFSPHVDNPDLRLRGENLSQCKTCCPDTLSLLCLRQQEGVYTSLLQLDKVLADLSSADINALSEPYFSVKRPDSFEGDELYLQQVPLLIKDNTGHVCSRFDYHNISTSSYRHQIALENLKRSSTNREKWQSFALKPGQILTFDNQRNLHSRNGFVPNFDGKDRWLLRMFGLQAPPTADVLLEEDCHHHLRTFYRN